MLRKLLIPLILLEILCLGVAQAYVENPNIFPLGEKESLMANTGVALSGSSGAAFYNPAGLASVTNPKISMSANSYMIINTQFRPLDRFDGHDLNFDAAGFLAVPSSLVSVQKTEPWTLAFSVFVPEQNQVNDMSSFSTTNFNTQLIQSIRAQFILLGLSAAAPLEQGFDFGFGCFYGNYNAATDRSLVAVPKVGSGITNNAYTTQSLSVDVHGVLCNAGLQMEVSPQLQFGFTTKLPFFKIKGAGKYFSYSQDINGTVSNTGIKNVSADYDIPMNTSVGFRYLLNNKTSLLLDVSYQFPVTYEPYEGAAAKVETKGTARWNLGAIYRWSEKFNLLAGYASNPSNQKLAKVGDLKEDFTVMQLGFEMIQKIATTGVGVFVANSKGESIVSATQRGSVTTTAYGLILTAGFSY